MTKVTLLNDEKHEKFCLSALRNERASTHSCVMKRRYILVSALFVLTASVQAQSSEEPLVLNRDICVERALANNRSFQSTTVALGTAQREAEHPLSVLIPSLDATTSLDYSTPLFSDPTSTQEGWTVGAAVSASLPLERGLVYSIRETQLDYQAQLITWEEARMQLASDVESEFYYLLASASNLEILETGLELARQRYEQTRIKFENGRASEVEMLQAQVSAAEEEPDYLSARAEYDQRLRSFLIVLGVDLDTEVELDGELETERWDFDGTSLLRLVEERPDIRNSRLTLETLKNSRSLAVSTGRTPVVSLSAGWATSVSDAFESESWESGTWADSASVGLSVTMPLDGFIPQSETDQSIAAIDDQIVQAEISLQETIDSARVEIINLLAQLETSWSNIELSRLTMDYAQTAYEMSEEAYRRGTMERLDVEDSQQSYLSAQQSNLESRYEYIAALIDLRTALGVESLEEVLP